MSTYNRQLCLAHQPVGAAKETDWNLVEEPLPTPGEGEFVVKILQLSIDPAMRGWMDAAPSYIPPVEIGAVMRAFAAGRVIESHHPQYATGDLVTGEFGVQEYALSTGAGVYRIDPRVDIPLSAYLGVLGLTGITAYFGLLDVGGFQPGQTVVVSGAAGAVGSAVGQIVKAKGGRAIGIAGGEQNAATSSSGWASTPRSTTRPKRCGRRCAGTHQMASSCSSTTSADPSSTRS